ncbi:MAG: zinc ribbon domain-containing protein [Desulfovibrionaceae bacterium]|nr:zinc ribbon domain-containing protein [Desulfovibrionaceae bacterium]MBF0512623.1 zinc ribbon domain-containing protein [Desulfovibrionaceae bacterium]
MPIYEYRCNECGQVFEEWQRDFKTREKACPVCKGESERIMSNTTFVLKGGGWYVTDYSKQGAASAAGAANPSGAADSAASAGAEKPAACPSSEPAGKGAEAAKPAKAQCASCDKTCAAAS